MLRILKMAAAGDEQPNPDAEAITFETFWAQYPKHVAKKDAIRAWAKIRPTLYPQIMEAVEKFRRSRQWRENGGQFVPHGATWLNGERWTDELEADLTMGACKWNCNGTREPGQPQCAKQGVKEKGGVVYCRDHAARVNG